MHDKLSKIKVLKRVIIAKDPSRYRSFPDVVRAANGSLICAFRDANIHFPADEQQTFLQIATSFDNGETWSKAKVFEHEPGGKNKYAWHCPRLSILSDGRLALICDRGRRNEIPEIYVAFSTDHGATWSLPVATGAFGILPDRVIELSSNEFIFTAHWENPKTKTLEQTLYASDNGGRNWHKRSIIASDQNYNFCEGSIVELKDKSLLCFLRENSFIHHPTFVAHSQDDGFTWSIPEPHPTHAHRPCAGKISADNILLTYRDVSSNPGLCAWIGSPLERGFSPAMRNLSGQSVANLGESLVIGVDGNMGDRSCGDGAELFLHPLRDWDAQFSLEAQVRCIEAQSWGCVISACGFLQITPRHVRFLHFPDADKPDDAVLIGETPISPGETHHFGISYTQRQIEIRINGVKLISGAIGKNPLPWQRKISLGNSYPGPPWLINYCDNRVVSSWSDLSLEVIEDNKVYRWQWKSSAKDFPNEYERQRVFRISEETSGDLYESGYSGWISLNEKHIYCVNYERCEQPKPYVVGYLLELY